MNITGDSELLDNRTANVTGQQKLQDNNSFRTAKVTGQQKLQHTSVWRLNGRRFNFLAIKWPAIKFSGD